MPTPSSPLVVLTPTGFNAVSAQESVILSWNQTPLATSYWILRSTDNVTFTDLANTSSLQYVDTTGTVGTTYYYEVQAANSTPSYGNPTASLSAVPLNPGQTTVGNVVIECRQRCDKVNSLFYSDQEMISMVSQSYKELYDIIIQKFGDDYYVADPYSFTTTNGDQFYALPSDFYKLLGVEVALNYGDPNSWVSLKEFNFAQRNLYNFPNVYTMYGITNLRYRLNGNNLYIVPIPSAGQFVRIWYSPRPNQLINSTDTLDAISGYEEYIVADVCIKMLAKEESDVSVFAAQKQALLQRIIEAAENRDVGMPQTVTDARRMNFSWSDPNDGGGFY